MSIFEYNEEEEKRKLREAEYEAGVISAKKEVAISLSDEGDLIEKIARVLHESEETIEGWVNEKMDIKLK